MEPNPYESPEIGGGDAPQEGRRVTSYLSWQLRFCLIVIVGSIGLFGAWCIADILLVRFASPDLGGLLLLLPILVGLGGAAVLRDVSPGLRLALSIGAAFFASIFGSALAVFLGIPFHFWIGGTL